MIDLAIEHNIILFELPPHTTHRLQPCDVGVFGPLKREWNCRTLEILDETGRPLQTKDVVREYLDVRKRAFKPETIRQAFYKSGIEDVNGCPHCDVNRFSEADFAPSISTSTVLNLPLGFPPDIGDEQGAGTELEQEPGLEPETEYASSSEDGADDEDSGDEFEPSQQAENESLTPPRPAPTPRAPAPFSQIPLVSHYYDSDDDTQMDSAPDEGEDDLADQIAWWKARALHYKTQRDRARSERDTATAHAILAGRSIQQLQVKLNTKKSSKKKDRSIVVGGRVVSTQEGRAEAEKQKRAREEKENKAEKLRQKRNDADVEMRMRRQELGRESMGFSGALSGQRLAQLRDLAWSLRLSETGTREELIARIQAHFDGKPNLREDARYTNIFGARRRRLQESTEEPRANGTFPTICAAARPSTPPPQVYHHLNELSNSPSKASTSHLPFLPAHYVRPSIAALFNALYNSMCLLATLDAIPATPTGPAASVDRERDWFLC